MSRVRYTYIGLHEHLPSTTRGNGIMANHEFESIESKKYFRVNFGSYFHLKSFKYALLKILSICLINALKFVFILKANWNMRNIFP